MSLLPAVSVSAPIPSNFLQLPHADHSFRPQSQVWSIPSLSTAVLQSLAPIQDSARPAIPSALPPEMLLKVGKRFSAF